jgi:hypothetical protein
MKRIAVATLFGLGAGVICASLLFSFNIVKYSAVVLIWVLLNRAVMGFAIGASGLRVHWAWNGVILGLAVGSVFSYFLFMTVGASLLPVANFFVNGLFGLAIEFLTTVVCRQAAMPRPTEKRTVVA